MRYTRHSEVHTNFGALTHVVSAEILNNVLTNTLRNAYDMLSCPSHLLFLLNNPELDRAVDIVKCRGLAKSHVSLSVGTLEEKGFLRRRESASDRRTVHLMLHGSGRDIALEAQELQKEFFQHLFVGLTPEEMELWRRVTEKVTANILSMETT